MNIHIIIKFISIYIIVILMPPFNLKNNNTFEENNTSNQNEIVNVCKVDNAEYKAWMDYRTITDNTSRQYVIVSQSQVDSEGLLSYEGKYCVALGSYYGPIGSCYRVTLSSGQIIDVIKADEKADEHTIGGCANSNGSMIEFIVDTDVLNEQVMLLGDVNVLFDGNIVGMEKEDD